MQNDLLNVQEVAAILKIARNTVYELIKRGELHPSKVGKQLRVSQSEIDAYLQRTKEPFHGAAQNLVSSRPNAAEIGAVHEETLVRGNELIICGQDISLDILVTQINSLYESIPVFRSYLGSYNGLYALYQGKVNVATAHLWDGDKNTYNVTYVEKMLPGVPAMIVRIGQRKEGYYVREGNPKGVSGWDDLRRNDLMIVNREKGSGVRVLLDEKLRLMGASGEAIPGYQTEVKTHLAVAAHVSDGQADLGIGSEKSAASVPGIEFIPLQTECYDLVIRRADAEKPQFRALLDVMASDTFRQDVEKIAGFDISQTGRIISDGKN